MNHWGLNCCRLAISVAQSPENRKASRNPSIDAPVKMTSPHRTMETGIPTRVGWRFVSSSFWVLSAAYGVAKPAGL